MTNTNIFRTFLTENRRPNKCRRTLIFKNIATRSNNRLRIRNKSKANNSN